MDVETSVLSDPSPSEGGTSETTRKRQWRESVDRLKVRKLGSNDNVVNTRKDVTTRYGKRKYHDIGEKGNQRETTFQSYHRHETKYLVNTPKRPKLLIS